MNKKGSLSDTKEIRRPKVPDPHTNGKTNAPHTAIRRATMTGSSSTGKTMPTRRPPTAAKKRNAQAKKRKNSRKISKSGVFMRVLIILICLFGAVFTMYSANILTAVNRFRLQSSDESSSYQTSAIRDSGVRTILLIGTDGAKTAESIVLLSISSHNHTVTLTPVMPDCYVSIPGHKTDSLCEAYTVGGADLLADTIANNFEIYVDSYYSYTPTALEQTVDLLSGISATVTETERAAVNQMLLADQIGTDLLNSPGTVTMNGKQLLAFSRYQNSADTPAAQAERRVKILNAFAVKLKNMSFDAFRQIRDRVFPEIQTNLSVGSMYLLALKLPFYMLRYSSRITVLPADGTWSEQTTPENRKVLAVDFDANAQIFKDSVTMPIK